MKSTNRIEAPDEKAMRLLCHQKAEKLWASFDSKQRACVRFGMLPAGPMQEADAEGYDGRLLAVAIMEQAQADGGMIA